MTVADSLPGHLSVDELEELGLRLREMTPGVIERDEGLRPFTVEDVAGFLDAGLRADQAADNTMDNG